MQFKCYRRWIQNKKMTFLKIWFHWFLGRFWVVSEPCPLHIIFIYLSQELAAQYDYPDYYTGPEPDDASGALREVPNWPTERTRPLIGQVGGLAVDSEGQVVVFHRAERRWDARWDQGHLTRYYMLSCYWCWTNTLDAFPFPLYKLCILLVWCMSICVKRMFATSLSRVQNKLCNKKNVYN